MGRKFCLHRFQQVVIIAADRETSVKVRFHPCLRHRKHRECQRQRSGSFCLHRHAKRLSLGIIPREALSQAVNQLRLSAGCKWQAIQKQKQGCQRIFAFLWCRGVCALTDCGDHDHIFLCLQLKLYASLLRHALCHRTYLFLGQSCNCRMRLARNNIDLDASLDGQDPRILRRYLKRSCHMPRETSFFDIDNRERSIRGKCHRRFLLHFIIMFNIAAAALLICSQNQAVIFCHRDSQFFDRTHRIQSCYRRSLVIRRAASVQLSVFYNRFKRLCHSPALACRDNIQVCQNI